jgi:CO/xanthine dehydrogenase Mo-binding subunit
MKLGAKRDGTLTAVDCDVLLDLGSGSLYAGKYALTLHQIWELYRCPNVSVRITAVYTTTPPTGPQRGVLDPIAAFCMESSIDDLAAALGMDPLAVRRRNYSSWYDEDKKIPYSSKRLDACMDKVTHAIGWERRDDLTRQTGVRRRGIGMASYCLERSGYAPFSAKADVIVRPDASVELRAGVVEIGAGQVTVLPMIAAEELGISTDRIAMHYGDTQGTHYAPSSHASRITIEVGPATLQAASLVRRQLFELAAPRLGVTPDRLMAADDRICVRDDASRGMSFAQACALIGEGELRATGSRAPNPAGVEFRVFGAHAVEVEVDVETGEVKILRFVSSHDIGQPINPKLVESQQFGAVVMGLGYALYEEPEIDGKTGIILNTDVHQYRTPTALETPHIETLNVEGEDTYYPYSAKPVGEAPLIGVMPAVRNAVRHALGFGINELPITAARIVEARTRAGAPLAG